MTMATAATDTQLKLTTRIEYLRGRHAPVHSGSAHGIRAPATTGVVAPVERGLQPMAAP